MPSDSSLHLTDFLRKSNVICNLPPVGRCLPRQQQ